MEKDFDGWNEIKKRTHHKKQAPYFHEREVWWAIIGTNVGSEIDGGEKFLRPIIVLKKFNRHTFWGIPLTGRKKIGVLYIPIETYHGRTSYAVLSQLRLFDSRRLFKKIRMITKYEQETLISSIVCICSEEMPKKV